MTARTLVVIDDHSLFREALVSVIDSEADLSVIGQGASGHDALELVRRLRPDIALVDVEMPGPPPVEVVRSLVACSPTTAVAVLTMHDDAEMIRALLGEGATAYLAKSIMREQLISALRSMGTGDYAHVAVSRPNLLIATASAAAARPVLTGRELEVIRCVAMALSNQQTATRLHISEGTVKRHLTNIFAKLDAVSRLDAVRKAHAARLLTLDDFS